MGILMLICMFGAIVFVSSNFVPSKTQTRWLQLSGCSMQFVGWIGASVTEGSNSSIVFSSLFGVLLVLCLMVYHKEYIKDIRSLVIDEEAEQREKARKDVEQALIKSVQESQERAKDLGNNYYE